MLGVNRNFGWFSILVLHTNILLKESLSVFYKLVSSCCNNFFSIGSFVVKYCKNVALVTMLGKEMS